MLLKIFSFDEICSEGVINYSESYLIDYFANALATTTASKKNPNTQKLSADNVS